MDIARECGLNVGTVSKILNNVPGLSVRDHVRRKTIEVAARLNYRPNGAAQNLRRGLTGLVGVFCSAQAAFSSLQKIFITGIERHLRSAAKQTFYRFPPPEGEPSAAIPFRMDAAVLMQGTPAQVVGELRRLNIRFVTVNERIEGSLRSVLPDESQGARLVVDHLQRRGHERVAYINSFASMTAHYSVRERHDAICSQAEAAGVRVVPGHRVHPGGSDIRRHLDDAVRRRKATAVIAYNFHVAIALVRAAHLLGLAVPGDVSLVGFDDVYPLQFLSPALTVVGLDAEAVGARAAELAVEIAEPRAERAPPKGGGPTPGVERVEYRLVTRESTGAPPACDGGR
jgi:LacI family transcriptional regulator